MFRAPLGPEDLKSWESRLAYSSMVEWLPSTHKFPVATLALQKKLVTNVKQNYAGKGFMGVK